MQARLALVEVCLAWAAGCAVYDGSLVGSGRRPDGGTGGASAGFGGSSIVGSGAGGTDITGTGGSGSPTDGGPAMSGGSGGIDGGGAGTAAGGSSGAAAGREAAPPGTELLIDSMEHAGDVVLGAGFSGHWYLFNDQTDGGVETPYPFTMTMLDVPNAGVPASTQAAHAAATGFTGWGCGMGFAISSTGGGKYDASAYTGITFWAHVGAGDAGAATHITVSTFDSRADTGCVKCGDQPLTSFDATTTWQKIHLPFAQFRQAGWGDPQFGAYDPTKGFGGAQFYIGGGAKLDVWIDDVAFYAQ